MTMVDDAHARSAFGFVPREASRGDGTSAIGDVVRAGLSTSPKRLPSWLFYDARGSELFEAITRTPEYYVTRCERALLERHGADIVAAAAGNCTRTPTLLELGAGNAEKSQVLVERIVARWGGCVFMPIDVSRTALSEARSRMQVEVPAASVCPLVTTNEDALVRMRDMRHNKVLLFLGSSIGNYDDAGAVHLLREIRASLLPGDALVLGVDLIKSLDLLVPAYDDMGGVTREFNMNLLERINREVGATFDTRHFRHVAAWNARERAMESFLESTVDQLITVRGMHGPVRFRAGERMQTECSYKYDDARVDALLTRAQLRRERTFSDGMFALHVVRTTEA